MVEAAEGTDAPAAPAAPEFSDAQKVALRDRIAELDQDQIRQIFEIVKRAHETGDGEGDEIEIDLDFDALAPGTLRDLQEYVDALPSAADDVGEGGEEAHQGDAPGVDGADGKDARSSEERRAKPQQRGLKRQRDENGGGSPGSSRGHGSESSGGEAAGDGGEDEEIEQPRKRDGGDHGSGSSDHSGSVLSIEEESDDEDDAIASAPTGSAPDLSPAGAPGSHNVDLSSVALPEPSRLQRQLPGAACKDSSGAIDGEVQAWAAREAEKHAASSAQRQKPAAKAPPPAKKAKMSLMSDILKNIGGENDAQFKPAFEMTPAPVWQGLLTVSGTRYSARAHATLPPDGCESADEWTIKRKGMDMLPPNWICGEVARREDLPHRWTHTGNFAVPLEDVAFVIFPGSPGDTPAYNGLLRHLEVTRMPLRIMLNSDVQMLVLPNVGLPNCGQDLHRGPFIWAAIMPIEVRDEGSLVPKGSRSPTHAASIALSSVRSILKRRGSVDSKAATEKAAKEAEATVQAAAEVMRASREQSGHTSEKAATAKKASADAEEAAAAAGGGSPADSASPGGGNAGQQQALPPLPSQQPAHFGSTPAERASMVGASPFKGCNFILPGCDVSKPEVSSVIAAAEAAGGTYQSRMGPDDHDKVDVVVMTISFLRALPENRWFDLNRLQRRRGVVFVKNVEYLKLCVRTGLRLDPTPLGMALFPQGGFVLVDRRLFTASPRAANKVLEALAATSASSAAREGLRMAALMRAHRDDEDTNLGERRSSGERWVMKLPQQDVDFLRRAANSSAPGAKMVAKSARATLDALAVHRRRVLMITPEEESKSKNAPIPQIVRNAVKIATILAENFRFAILVTNDPELSAAARHHRGLLRCSLDKLPDMLKSLDKDTGSLGLEFDFLSDEKPSGNGRAAGEQGVDASGDGSGDGSGGAIGSTGDGSRDDSATPPPGTSARKRKVSFSTEALEHCEATDAHKAETSPARRSPMKERWIDPEEASAAPGASSAATSLSLGAPEKPAAGSSVASPSPGADAGASVAAAKVGADVNDMWADEFGD